VIDIEHRLVLFETSIVGFVLFSIYGIILRGFINTIIGALAGFLIMLLFYFLGMAFTKIIGKLRLLHFLHLEHLPLFWFLHYYYQNDIARLLVTNRLRRF